MNGFDDRIVLPRAEGHRNVLLFSGLDGAEYMYENIFGTIHKRCGNTDDLESGLRCLAAGERKFSFDKDVIGQRLSSLDTLVLNATEGCNLRCRYCIYSGSYADERAHSDNDMSVETANKSVSAFLNGSKQEPYIMFYGGEPMRNMNLVESVVELTKSHPKNPKYGMTTNLTLAEKYLNYLMSNDFMLTVSLDGPRHLHDRWRVTKGGSPTFDKVYDNLQRIYDQNRDYFLSKVALSVTMPETGKIREVKDFFERDSLLSGLPLRIQAIEPNDGIVKSNRSGEQEFWRMARDYGDKVAHGRMPTNFEKAMFDDQLNRIYSRKVGQIDGAMHPPGMCVPGARKVFVGTDGGLHMCEKLGTRVLIGSVETGIEEKKVADALSDYCKIKDEVCQDCWAYRECGSCAASAKSSDGISAYGQKANCGRLKQPILTGLAIYSYVLSKGGKGMMELYFKEWR